MTRETCCSLRRVDISRRRKTQLWRREISSSGGKGFNEASIVRVISGVSTKRERPRRRSDREVEFTGGVNKAFEDVEASSEERDESEGSEGREGREGREEREERDSKDASGEMLIGAEGDTDG